MSSATAKQKGSKRSRKTSHASTYLPLATAVDTIFPQIGRGDDAQGTTSPSLVTSDSPLGSPPLSQGGRGDQAILATWLSLTPLVSEISSRISQVFSQGEQVDQADITCAPRDNQILSRHDHENRAAIATCLPITPLINQVVSTTNQEQSYDLKSLRSEDPKHSDVRTELPPDVAARPTATGSAKIVVRLPPYPPSTTPSHHIPTKSSATISQNNGTPTSQQPKAALKGRAVPVRVAKKKKSTRRGLTLSSRHSQQPSGPKTHSTQVNTKKNVANMEQKVSPARGRGPARYDPQSLLPPILSHTLDSPTISIPGPQLNTPSLTSSSQPTTPPNAAKTSRNGKGKPPIRPFRNLSHTQNNLRPLMAMASRYQNALRQDWKEWQEVAVKVSLPRELHLRIKDIWATFKDQGQISTIEMGDDDRREATAIVRFSPPPREAFWLSPTHRIILSVPASMTFYAQVQLDPSKSRRRKFVYISSKSAVQYPEVMVLPAESLDFGFMCQPSRMMTMCTVRTKDAHRIVFKLNLHRREIDVSFAIAARDARKQIREGQEKDDLKVLDFRFTVPLDQLTTIFETTSSDRATWMLSTGIPPRYFWKGDEARSFSSGPEDPYVATSWNQRDAWYRRTDICYDRSSLRSSPLTLKTSNPIIDIGKPSIKYRRWTTYRICFSRNESAQNQCKMLRGALEEHNVSFDSLEGFDFVPREEPTFWDFIPAVSPENPFAVRNKAVDDLTLLEMLQKEQITFPVRYQLEVCLSQGCLHEQNLSNDFVKKIMRIETALAQDFLEDITSKGKRCFEPSKALDQYLSESSGPAPKPKIPAYCTLTRSATVTPTMVYYNTPTVETSNRVVRDFAHHGDRFLRVRFTDEKNEGKVYSSDNDNNNEIFARIKRAMAHGILVGGRHYEFLAFGNSQFREHGAYFFSRTPELGPEHARSLMGDFSSIRIVAKYAARLGQCFSTTRAIHSGKLTLVEDEDVEDKFGHTFTDGVGKISQALAKLTSDQLGLAEPPSTFQFRLGGCKGVLTTWPDVDDQTIHIRQSQYKFAANHEGLEINRWSQFGGAFLNRQIISVLSILGVSDEVFTRKMRQQLTNLEEAMTDPDLAEDLLLAAVDANQMTVALASMILDGFQEAREPFAMSMLNLWRAWSTKYLKEKAKLFVPEGAFLLGCTDETRTLQGHFISRQVDESAPYGEQLEALPEVFVQILRNHDDIPQVITGPMSLARNPSLHPGDIRVVRGVDIPELRHLVNVVVLPQTGDRDLASMCSGGDLDGDDYLVMWDQALLPKSWNEGPMDYTAPVPSPLGRNVEIEDVHSFFVEHMKMDNLGKIATAHLALSDMSPHGVRDKKCIELARRHSMAVDYAKTGIAAKLPRELVPKSRPHFMEPKRKEPYHSKKVLGQLYDQVERIEFEPELKAPFDKRILEAFPLPEQMLSDARDIKKSYDVALRKIMAQHDIKTEFEVWSTFVLHHFNQNGDYKFHEVIGQLSEALKDQFRTVCYLKAGGHDFEEIAPFAAAMYTVTNEEIQQAVEERSQFKVVDGQSVPVREAEDMPLMSFPWIFHSVLGRIASGKPNSVHANKERKRQRRKAPVPSSAADDTLQTASGETRLGEVLALFEGGQSMKSTQQVDGTSGSDKMPTTYTNTWLNEKSNTFTSKMDRHKQSVSESSQSAIADLEGLDFFRNVTSPTPDADLSVYDGLEMLENFSLSDHDTNQAPDSAVEPGPVSSPTNHRHPTAESAATSSASDPITQHNVMPSETVDTGIMPPYLTTVRSVEIPSSKGDGCLSHSDLETSKETKNAKVPPLNTAFPALITQDLGANDIRQPFLGLSTTGDALGIAATMEQANKSNSTKVKQDTGIAVPTIDCTSDLPFDDGGSPSGPRTGASIPLGRHSFHHSTPSLDLFDGLVDLHESSSEDIALPSQISFELTRPRLMHTSNESDPWGDLACLEDVGKGPLATKGHVSQGSNDNGKPYLSPPTPECSQYGSMGLDMFERSITSNGEVSGIIVSPKERDSRSELLRHEQPQPQVSSKDRTSPRSVLQSHESPAAQIDSPGKQPLSEFRFPSRQLEDECPDCHIKQQPKGSGGDGTALVIHAASCKTWRLRILDAFKSPLVGPSEHKANPSGSSDLLLDLAPSKTAHVVTAESPRPTQGNMRETKDAPSTIDARGEEFYLSNDSSSKLGDGSDEEKVTLNLNTSGRAAWAKLIEMGRADD